MSGDYVIEIDQTARIAMIRGWGFFDVDTFRRFRNDAYGAAILLGGGHLAYADFRECTVQHQDVVSLAQGLFLNSPAQAKRVAIVIAGALQSRQARRIRVRAGMEVFDDTAEAMGWLRSDEGTRAASPQ